MFFNILRNIKNVKIDINIIVSNSNLTSKQKEIYDYGKGRFFKRHESVWNHKKSS